MTQEWDGASKKCRTNMAVADSDRKVTSNRRRSCVPFKVMFGYGRCPAAAWVTSTNEPLTGNYDRPYVIPC